MSFDAETICAQALADESIDAGVCDLYATLKNTTAGLDIFFLLFSATFVFLMQAGFAMLCAGSVREKNVKNIMLKNILDACGGALGFWSVGYAFAFGGASSDKKGFIGNDLFFLSGVTEGSVLISWFFQFAFAATAATIVAGTIAERCKFEAYLCYSLMLTGFVYPVVVYSIWSASGFLSAWNDDPAFGVGVHDFAGSGVVHLTGGLTALIAAKILGPRIGRFYEADGTVIEDPKPFPPHSTSLQVLGTLILWVGWYGFNPGSTLLISGGYGNVAALCAVTTTISGASGCASAMFTDMLLYRRKTGETAYDITMCMNGLLCGLVGITAGCAVVEPWAACVIGIVSGWVYIAFSSMLVYLKIDDAVDAVPVHLGGGIWGVLAVGIFAEPLKVAAAFKEHGHYGLIYGGTGNLILAQICGVGWIVGWVSLIMIPYFHMLNVLGLFRVDSIEEEVGLDISHHKGSAYSIDKPNDASLEKFELLRSQRKIELPRDE